MGDPWEAMREGQKAEIAVAQKEIAEQKRDRDRFNPGDGYAALARAECIIARNARYLEIEGVDWRVSTLAALRWFVFAVDAGYEFTSDEMQQFRNLTTSNATEMLNDACALLGITV